MKGRIKHRWKHNSLVLAHATHIRPRLPAFDTRWQGGSVSSAAKILISVGARASNFWKRVKRHSSIFQPGWRIIEPMENESRWNERGMQRGRARTAAKRCSRTYTDFFSVYEHVRSIVTDNNAISVDAEKTLPWNRPNERPLCCLRCTGDRGEHDIARKSKLIALSAI